MNYPNYFPQSYYQNTYGQPNNNPVYAPVQGQQQPMIQQTPRSSNSSIIWCQGEAGAKSFQVAPNQSVMLMDSESNTFFIKSADASGMPLPLRIFDYTERTQQQPVNEPQIQTQPLQATEYITREEFEKRISEITQSNERKVIPQRKDKATT